MPLRGGSLAPETIPAYDPGEFFDEAYASVDVPRPHYAPLLAHLGATNLDALRASVAEGLAEAGVVFGGARRTRPFVVDPIPRLLPAAEWAVLERGIAQRAVALDRFVADVYGEREIVTAGVVPARMLDGAEFFEPRLRGFSPPGASWSHVAGLDLVRGDDGRLAVLEDNLRTPSGLAYALGARDVILDRVGTVGLAAAPRELHDAAISALHDALVSAAPASARDEPVIALLSDGPANSAWWEHRTLVEALDIELVTLADLDHRGGRLVRRDEHGTAHSIDIVYRRTDEDRLTDASGALTDVGAVLIEPWLAGRLGVVNAFGTGVADDKLAHAHVEAMVRFYLDEEPLLASVPTYDLGDPAVAADALDRLDELVVKPRTGYGGLGVVIGPHATSEELRATATAITRTPDAFVAQETVRLSTHPTVVEGRLEPRHVDLRPFAYRAGARTAVPPGGLTRVALRAGALVVNSTQEGGAKDTWVLTS